MTKVCGVLDVTCDSDFASGTIVTRRMGEMRMSLITADGHAVRKVRRSPDEGDGHVYVMVPVRGAIRISQDDHDLTVNRGDVISVDSSRPYFLASREPMKLAAVRFPRQVMGLSVEDTQALTAVPWSPSSGVGAVASALITSLAIQLTELSEAELQPLGGTVDGVVRSLFAERIGPPDDNGHDARGSLLRKIQAYAKEHLENPDITPTALAAQHNISLRYLQLLFAEQGLTPASWLRDERLARCREALSNPRLDHLTVAAIGATWGLGDGRQMSRLFRRAYGVLPSELRRRSPAFAAA